MKFKCDQDKLDFLFEAGRMDLKPEGRTLDEVVVPEEVSELFVKKRDKLLTKMKDFRRSQSSKSAWDKNRWKYMRGIRKFHKSIEGKRFHRSLGRFLSTRLFEPKKLTAMSFLRNESLKAVSSLRTHLYVESAYYRDIDEDLEFHNLYEYAIPLLCRTENNLFNNHVDEISDEELELLLRLTQPNEILKQVMGVNTEDSTQFNEDLKSFSSLLEAEDSDSSFYLLELVRTKQT